MYAVEKGKAPATGIYRTSSSISVRTNNRNNLARKIFGKEYNRLRQPQHMAKLINYALFDILLQYKNTLIFEEYIFP